MNFRLIKTAASIVALLGAFTSPVATAAGHSEAVAEGQRVAFDRKLGNCLTCHRVTGKLQEGNIGPPLIAMKARFPDKSVLRAQIHDSTVSNPATLMPPFGKHRILTEKQIDQVTEYIYSL